LYSESRAQTEAMMPTRSRPRTVTMAFMLDSPSFIIMYPIL